MTRNETRALGLNTGSQDQGKLTGGSGLTQASKSQRGQLSKFGQGVWEQDSMIPGDSQQGVRGLGTAEEQCATVWLLIARVTACDSLRQSVESM